MSDQPYSRVGLLRATCDSCDDFFYWDVSTGFHSLHEFGEDGELTGHVKTVCSVECAADLVRTYLEDGNKSDWLCWKGDNAVRLPVPT